MLLRATFLNILSHFWRQHPALLYGCALFLGFSSAFHWHPSIIFPCVALFCPLLLTRKWSDTSTRILLALSITICAFCYIRLHHQFPQLDTDGIDGIADIEITSIIPSKTRFSEIWICRGTIDRFTTHSQHPIGKNIPFKMTLPRREEQPPLQSLHYHLPATMTQLSSSLYHIKPEQMELWQPINDSWSLPLWRYRAKQMLLNYIHNHIPNPSTASFLIGIATGNFDDPHLAFEFSRFGLQHIMAISGFHFGIISAFLLFFLRFWMPYRTAAAVLIILMSGYFFFLGPTPSVMRSWITAIIVLTGILIGRSGNALNALGIAMLAVLIFDPSCCLSLTFQLSFLITATILLFYPVTTLWMQKLWKKRALNQMLTMNTANQYGYIILNMLRDAIALSIAVHITAIPITLFYFYKFPWIGFLYNLFFPLAVTLSMFMLMLALSFCWLPFIASTIHHLNAQFTQLALDTLFYLPTSFDYYLRVDSISLLWINLYLSLVFLIGIRLKQSVDEKEEFGLLSFS
jgi:competence protein ComEC